jgi:diaminopimelate epimerase
VNSDAGPGRRTAHAPSGRLPFAKGHGTQNDFVVVPDPDAALDLTPTQVAALCERRAGIGGDGLLRVVRSAPLAEATGEPSAGDAVAEGAEWFMDYRNADGSVAEMCGNGVRTFVAYLIHAGLVRLPDGAAISVGTRAGVKRVRREGALLAVDLGPWRLVGGRTAPGNEAEITVHLPGPGPSLSGLGVDLGNPHTVVRVPDVAALRAVDLREAPAVCPPPVTGTNVEVVVVGRPDGKPEGSRAEGFLTMRVHERGVGETRSCGTGAAAAVLAARAWAGPEAPRVWTVQVPGGRLRVSVTEDDIIAGRTVELAGPAVILAEGTVDPALFLTDAP